jgi:3'(2'), 5'-bisphosphate nucleotidase
MSLRDDVDLASRLACDAGRAILALRTSAPSGRQTKPDDSPVTPADLAADRVLREGLALTGDVVVTEETWGGQPLPRGGRVWVVDPLDGTQDFLRGSDEFAVHVALVIDGAPRVGVVLRPVTGVLWRGIVDGAQSSCERIDGAGRTTHPRARPPSTPPLRPRLATSISHPSPVAARIVDAIGGVAVPRGSLGLKAAMIVDDEADLYVSDSRRIKVWDTAAPAAVVLAAGGSATSSTGAPLGYDREVAHDDGVALWSPWARAALAPRVHAVVGSSARR